MVESKTKQNKNHLLHFKCPEDSRKVGTQEPDSDEQLRDKVLGRMSHE